MSTSVSFPSAKSDLFGHPRALAFLFTTEMWERFSYYGMRSLLVLYMVKYLLLPGRVEDVIGMAGLKHLLEIPFWPVDSQPLASQIYGLYTPLVSLTPLFGGSLPDRALGLRPMGVTGPFPRAPGLFLLRLEPLLLFALLCLILGN